MIEPWECPGIHHAGADKRCSYASLCCGCAIEELKIKRNPRAVPCRQRRARRQIRMNTSCAPRLVWTTMHSWRQCALSKSGRPADRWSWAKGKSRRRARGRCASGCRPAGSVTAIPTPRLAPSRAPSCRGCRDMRSSGSSTRSDRAFPIGGKASASEWAGMAVTAVIAFRAVAGISLPAPPDKYPASVLMEATPSTWWPHFRCWRWSPMR